MQQLTTTQMTVDQFSQYIRNRKDMYEACVQNGFYLPKIKSNMITEEYMRNVMQGKAFCPRFKDIKMLPCPRPPNKELLQLKFQTLVATMEWAMTGIDEKHQPDKRWLLDVLSTYSPGDDIFKKSYLPPVKDTKLSEIKSIEVPTEFMRGLP